MSLAVLGIDPSLAATGFCTVSGRTFSVAGVHGDDRLLGLSAATRLEAEAASLAVLEDLPTHGMGAGKTGMAQGVIRLALLNLMVPYVLVTPASLKKFATGRGNATKADMRVEMLQRAGVDKRDDNEVDAWWLRQLGLAHYDAAEVRLPRLHLGVLDKIDWTPAPKAVAA